jgi:hypothetical protein
MVGEHLVESLKVHGRPRPSRISQRHRAVAPLRQAPEASKRRDKLGDVGAGRGSSFDDCVGGHRARDGVLTEDESRKERQRPGITPATKDLDGSRRVRAQQGEHRANQVGIGHLAGD